jgi:hypothetical protein
MRQALTVNGLEMPASFPVGSFERTYASVRTKAAVSGAACEHFVGAWNALSLRFLALTHGGDALSASLAAGYGGGDAHGRYVQEQHLFSFFSVGFAALEAYFYGLFAIGAILRPADFPLTTPKDQQSVSPPVTERAFARAYAGDAILTVFQAVFADTSYREWREVRNVLTHRTAPGRTIYVGVGSDEQLAAQWKLNNIVLDGRMVPHHQAQMARMLTLLLDGSAQFAEAQIR